MRAVRLKCTRSLNLYEVRGGNDGLVARAGGVAVAAPDSSNNEKKKTVRSVEEEAK